MDGMTCVALILVLGNIIWFFCFLRWRRSSAVERTRRMIRDLAQKCMWGMINGQVVVQGIHLEDISELYAEALVGMVGHCLYLESLDGSGAYILHQELQWVVASHLYPDGTDGKWDASYRNHTRFAGNQLTLVPDSYTKKTPESVRLGLWSGSTFRPDFTVEIPPAPEKPAQ